MTLANKYSDLLQELIDTLDPWQKRKVLEFKNKYKIAEGRLHSKTTEWSHHSIVFVDGSIFGVSVLKYQWGKYNTSFH